MKKVERPIGWICILVLGMVMLPLLILSCYNYPSADDWSFGASVYQCIQNGGNLFEIIGAVFSVVATWRIKGEPRYANAFLGALQPGIWGERFYCITGWVMIGSLVFAELYFFLYLFGGKDKEKRWNVLPVILPFLTMQILCVPFSIEAFFWWTGAINYTFIFALSLIQLALFIRVARAKEYNGECVRALIVAIMVSVFVAGDNYATSLSSACLLVSLSLLLWFKDRKAFFRTLPITLVTLAGLLICLIAPGNQARLNADFDGEHRGAVYAVLMSLKKTALNIYSWTSLKVILLIILILPFLWKLLKGMKYHFKYPLLFTVFTYGIYSSQIVATMYVDGSTGGGRMAAILYFAYNVWVLLNVAYWVGWLQRNQKVLSWKWLSKTEQKIKKNLLSFFLVMGALLTVNVGITEIKQTSTYRACAWLLKGYAQDYAQAWEERLEVLHDSSVKEVYFMPLPGVSGEMIFYTDFEVGESWVNKSCANYYQKDYVGLKEE